MNGQSGSGLFLIIYLVIIFGAMWSFMIRPQRKKQKAEDAVTIENIGDTLTVTAVPAEGAAFQGWSTSHATAVVEDASALTTQVTFERMFSLTATFE